MRVLEHVVGVLLACEVPPPPPTCVGDTWRGSWVYVVASGVTERRCIPAAGPQCIPRGNRTTLPELSPQPLVVVSHVRFFVQGILFAIRPSAEEGGHRIAVGASPLIQPAARNLERLDLRLRDRFTPIIAILVRRWTSWRDSWRRRGRGCWWSYRRDTCVRACQTPPGLGAARYGTCFFFYLEKFFFTLLSRPRAKSVPFVGTVFDAGRRLRGPKNEWFVPSFSEMRGFARCPHIAESSSRILVNALKRGACLLFFLLRSTTVLRLLLVQSSRRVLLRCSTFPFPSLLCMIHVLAASSPRLVSHPSAAWVPWFPSRRLLDDRPPVSLPQNPPSALTDEDLRVIEGWRQRQMVYRYLRLSVSKAALAFRRLPPLPTAGSDYCAPPARVHALWFVVRPGPKLYVLSPRWLALFLASSRDAILLECAVLL